MSAASASCLGSSALAQSQITGLGLRPSHQNPNSISFTKPKISMMGLERKSSIDNEPLTLSLSQLEAAREAALFVMSTRSVEEALQIFTAGLKPVAGGSGSRRDDDDVENRMGSYEDAYEEFEDGESNWPMIKEVSSAPF